MTFFTREPARLAVALFSLLAAASPLLAQTAVLDDYSSYQFGTSYVEKNGHGIWNIVSGQVQPYTGGAGQYSAVAWTNQTLHNVGDAFSIDLAIAPVANGQNGGLAVWASGLPQTNPATDRLFEPRVGFNGSGFDFTSETNGFPGYTISTLSGTPLGLSTLTVTLSARDATTSTLTATLTGSGFAAISHEYTVSFVDPLFVGPSTWQGGAGNVVFDNFSYSTASVSAIPEPSTYAAIFGASALGLAAWRRRRASGSTNPASA
jgi:hypothetical protein